MIGEIARKFPLGRLWSRALWAGLALVAALGMGGLVTPSATAAAVLWVGGRPLVSDTPIQAEQGYLLVPAMAAFSPLGIKVSSASRAELQLQRDGRQLRLKDGSRTAYLNGEPLTLPVPARSGADDWLVPLSAVSIALQLELRWDGQMRVLHLSNGSTTLSNARTTPTPGHASTTPTTLTTPSTPPSNKATTNPAPPAVIQVTLDNTGADSPAESLPALVFRSAQPFTLERLDPSTVERGAVAQAAAADSQWQLRLGGGEASPRVALPAILPGHWPPPWRQVRLEPTPAAGQVKPAWPAPTGNGAVLQITLAPGYTLAGPWPLAAHRNSTGRYEAIVRLAAAPVGTSTAVSAPPSRPRLDFLREPGQSAQLVLGGLAPTATWQYTTEVWRDPDRLAITITGWAWPYGPDRMELADPDFSAIAVTPQTQTASPAATGSVQIVLWPRHPGWVRVVRSPERADSLELDVLRLVQEVRLDSQAGPAGDSLTARGETSAGGSSLTTSPPSETAVLRVDASGPFQVQRVFRLPNPERLVIDLSGVANPVGGARQSSPDPRWIRQLRVSQFDPHTVRVVAELAAPVSAEIRQSQDGASIWATLRLAEQKGGVTSIALQELHPPVDRQSVAAQLPANSRPAGTASPGLSTPAGAGSTDGPKVGSTLQPESLSHLKGRLIVLDAGHGGIDPGAIGVNGVQEKDVALSIVLQLQRVLAADGARVLLTRDRDIMVDWSQRVAPANLNHADALLSIHLNSYQGPSAHGVESYYHPDQDTSRRLAQALQQSLVERLQAYNGGARARDDLYVVRQSWVPAVLLEVGYLSNPDEAAKLADAGYQAQVVQAIATGLERYFRENLP